MAGRSHPPSEQAASGIRQHLYRLSLPSELRGRKVTNISLTDSLRSYVQRSAWHAILFLLLLVFTGASVFSFLGLLVAEFAIGIPLLTHQELLDDLYNPALIPALRVLQLMQGLGMLVLPGLIYLWVGSADREWRAIFRTPVRQSVLLALVVFPVALPFVNYVADWNASVELPSFIGDWMVSKEQHVGELTDLFLDMPTVWLLLLNLIMIALLPAVGEELIFRGVLQRKLEMVTRNPHAAIWLAAMLFSAFHFQFLGFVPRLLMGAAMGYLYFWSGNLWYPMIAHFTNNALAVVIAFGMQHGLVAEGLDDTGTGNQTLAAFSLVFCMMLLYLFKEYQQSITNSKGE